jgi:hypothetical protein
MHAWVVISLVSHDAGRNLMPDSAGATATLAAIDAQRSELRELLLTTDASTVAGRTSSGEWSPVENVRHLLFAEQLHFSQLLPEKQPWNAQGLAPHFLANEPPFKTVGTDPTTDLAEVLRAWDAVHASVCTLASSSSDEKLAEALDRNLKHLQFHVAIIRSLLSGATETEDAAP